MPICKKYCLFTLLNMDFLVKPINSNSFIDFLLLKLGYRTLSGYNNFKRLMILLFK